MSAGRSLVLLGILFIAGIATASLSPSVQQPRIEGAELEESARFARIDSLETVYEGAEGLERAQLGFRLGQLYFSTGLKKHKRLALEYLDEALAQEPDFFEAARLRASIAHGMRYTREAWKWLDELVALHPDDWRGYRVLGDFHFFEAKRVLDPNRFEMARRAYLSCVQLDSTQADAWYGLAASQLALQQFDQVQYVAERLETFESHHAAALFLAGAAASALGQERLADDRFQRALAESPPRVREVFEGGLGFLDPDNLPDDLARFVDPQELREAMRRDDPEWTSDDDVDLKVALADSSVRRQVVQAYWQAANPWPSHEVNKRQLFYWRRLVEADVLFGDATNGLRGWDTEMGQALVRWGRPTFTIYEPPSSGVDLDEWYARGVRLSREERIPSQAALWVWTYRREDTWFSLLFTDITYQAHWRAGGKTAENMLAMSMLQPLTFFDRETEPDFRLAVDTAVFPRAGNTTVESGVEVQLTRPSSSTQDPQAFLATVELAIYDGEHQLLEYVQRDLNEDHLRSRLHASLGAPAIPGPRDPLLCQIGASLPPGMYRLAVDVSQAGGGHRAVEVNLNVPTAVPPGLLALSDLQLATAFHPFTPDASTPREFVKHAYGVVPVPSGVYPLRAQMLFVYFEVQNLTRGDDGKTRFNVGYRVLRQPPGTHVARAGRTLAPEVLAAMEPVGLTFTEESTGVSPQSVVVKGGNVDIADLTPGRYVLLVEIEDLLANAKVSRYVAFTKAST